MKKFDCFCRRWLSGRKIVGNDLCVIPLLLCCEITMGNSVTSIGEAAFYGCKSLTDVYYDGSEEEWGKISIGGDNDGLTDATIHFLKTITAIEVFMI